MRTIKYLFQKGNSIASVPDELYGSFVEHLGRAVYSGIYEPGHPKADKNGFREDVASMIKELGISTVRYPGGNFVSGYNWRDGIGPKAERPVRLDYAWLSKETNQFGIDEFYTWCQKYDLSPMVAVNLGTGTPQDAGYFIEYCNFPGGTTLSELRKSHGRAEPYNFKLWCLGNEMDGPWQTCHLEAQEYVRKAHETAKIMRWVDPDIKLVGCGSATTLLPTYPEWDRIVLEGLYDDIDFLSCHHYFENSTGKTEDFLGSYVLMENFIHTIESTADFVKAKLRSKKDMMISFDEWNIWSIEGEPWMNYFADPSHRFTEKPPLLEQSYTLLDALVFGGLMCTLINHCDRVRMASLAQLVNVIAPIFTKEGGPAIAQTIFYPFKMVSEYGRGEALRFFADVPCIETVHGQTRTLHSSAVYNEERGEIAFFVLNLGKESARIELKTEGFGDKEELVSHTILSGPDLLARNTFETPNAVMSRDSALTEAEVRCLVTDVPALSFNRYVVKVN